jgi:hypothetical protein
VALRLRLSSGPASLSASQTRREPPARHWAPWHGVMGVCIRTGTGMRRARRNPYSRCELLPWALSPPPSPSLSLLSLSCVSKSCVQPVPGSTTECRHSSPGQSATAQGGDQLFNKRQESKSKDRTLTKRGGGKKAGVRACVTCPRAKHISSRPGMLRVALARPRVCQGPRLLGSTNGAPRTDLSAP